MSRRKSVARLIKEGVIPPFKFPKIEFIECKKCQMQIAEVAIKVHNELNHAPRVVDKAAAKKSGDRLRTLGHYHKGRRGKCTCEKGSDK